MELHREQDDDDRLQALRSLARSLHMPAVASGDVHMAIRRQRVLQDTMTAIRHGLPLADCGVHLFRNGERHLRARSTLGNVYPHELLAASVELAERCTFDLRTDLHYEYPFELVPEGETPSSHLRALTLAGMRTRWPDGTPAKVARQIDEELGAHRRPQVRGLLPHRGGHRPLCAQPQHPVPGARLVGQFGGVLCAGHHFE